MTDTAPLIQTVTSHPSHCDGLCREVNGDLVHRDRDPAVVSTADGPVTLGLLRWDEVDTLGQQHVHEVEVTVTLPGGSSVGLSLAQFEECVTVGSGVLLRALAEATGPAAGPLGVDVPPARSASPRPVP